VHDPKPYAPGQTFSINEPGSPHPHLYIVIGILQGRVLAVPLNTVTIYTDQTLILNREDHPEFIRHSTSVSYDNIRDFEVAHLYLLENMGPTLFERRGDCSVELLKRVHDLAFESDMIKPKYEKMLSEALGR
jgi:hypothetical protein